MYKKISLFIIVITAIAAFLVVHIKNSSNIPEGVPNNYFENIDAVEQMGYEIYVYSDHIDFNQDLAYTNITDINQIPVENNYNNVLIIDMNKYSNDDFATSEEISTYFSDYKTSILIVNYDNSNSNLLKDFIDPGFYESDLISYTYDQYHVAQIGCLSSAIPSEQSLMYSITHHLKLLYL